MTQKSVYLVTGFYFYYDDSEYWVVAAYLDEDQAREHVQRIRAEQQRVDLSKATTKEERLRLEDELDQLLENSPYDTGHHPYRGTKYSVVRVPFVMGLDDYLERPREENEPEQLED